MCAQSECRAAEKELDTTRKKMVVLEISSGVMKEERDRLRAEVRTFLLLKRCICLLFSRIYWALVDFYPLYLWSI